MYQKDQEEKSPLRGLGCLILFIGNAIKAFEKCKEELLDCFEKCDDAALYIKNRETFSSRSVLQKANEIELIMTNKELDEQFGK